MKAFVATTKDRSHIIMVVAETEDQARIMARNATNILPHEFQIHVMPTIIDKKSPFQATKLDKRLKSTKTLMGMIDKRTTLTSEINKLNDEIKKIQDGDL